MITLDCTPDEAAAVVFGGVTQAGMNYIQNSVNRFMSSATHLPNTIVSSVQNQYQNFVESESGRRIQALRHKMNSFWQDDTIRPMHDMHEIQQAPDAMVRWIMANPTLREHYHNDRIEGYGDRYYDRQPDRIGEQHYDYRRVKDGIVQFNGDGHASVTRYYEPLHPNDPILSVMDQISIQSTWDSIDKALDDGEGIDPTSEWNNLLG